MAAPTGLLRLIPGASRVTGTRYQRAPVTGDFWIEIVDAQCRLGNEFALASDPTLSGRQSDLSAIPADIPKVPAASVAAGVTPAAPVNLNPPSISGVAQVGQVLTRVNGTWANLPTSYAHQWYANGVAIQGATGATYTPVTADIGKAITVSTVASNAIGSSPLITSAATSAVIAASAVLSISGANGSAAVGDATSFTPTISGGTAPYTVTATGLPPGRSITNAATGLTTGAYTTAGSYSATYTVKDNAGATASFTRTVTVSAASAGLPFPQSGARYDLSFATAQYFGGTQPLSPNTDDGRFFRQQIFQGVPMLSEQADGSLLSQNYQGLRIGTRGLWIEPRTPTTNPLLWNRDLTNTAWTKTNATAAKTLAGRDAVANAASQVTAGAAGATVLQAVTFAGGSGQLWADLKPIAGTASIDVTVDGGTTWTTIPLNAPRFDGWGRYGIPVTSIAANPTVGFRLAASGDVVGIDLVGIQTLGYEDSPLAQTSTATTRFNDRPSTAVASDTTTAQAHGSGFMDFMAASNTWGMYVAWANRRTPLGHGVMGVNLTVNADGTVTFKSNTTGGTVTTTNTVKPWPAVNKVIAFANNGVGKICLNGGPVATANASSAGGFAAYTDLNHIDIGSNGGGTINMSGYVQRLSLLDTLPSDADMQARTASTSAGGSSSTADSTSGTADNTGMTADGSTSGGTTPAAKNLLTEDGRILTTEDGRAITKE